MRTVENSRDVIFSSNSEEWYTPKYILQRVLDVLGEIDLDPCAEKHTEEGPNVPAKKHITKAEDGLKAEWRGKVFANPPYGKDMRAWAAKFRAEYMAGRMT